MNPYEKDKLLFRLIAKDDKLAEKLAFELLEDGHTTESRRAELKQLISDNLHFFKKHSYFTPGYLLMELRENSAHITRHVQVTKDKYGEIELNLYMLIKALDLFADELTIHTPQRKNTLSTYVVKRTLKILSLLQKLHVDLRLDFEKGLHRLAKLLKLQADIAPVAQMEGLNLEWLKEGGKPAK